MTQKGQRTPGGFYTHFSLPAADALDFEDAVRIVEPLRDDLEYRYEALFDPELHTFSLARVTLLRHPDNSTTVVAASVVATYAGHPDPAAAWQPVHVLQSWEPPQRSGLDPHAAASGRK